MKKILLFIAILMLPLSAQAATMSSDAVLAKDKIINDNYYVAAGNPTILGTVNGDLLVAGGNVLIAGDVMQDLEVTGGNVTITGNVNGDVRVFAGSVVLSGKIGGEVIIASGQTTVEGSALIGRDLIIASGNVNISPSAQIRGKRTVFEGEQAENKVTTVQKKDWEGGLIMGMLIGKLFVMLAMLLAATLLFALFPSITKAVAAEGATSKNMLRNFGLGLLVLIVTPVLILISFITGIGYFVALLMSFLYILAMMVSMVLAGLVFGRWMQKVVLKKSKADLNWGFALGGVAVLSLIALIPFVGWLICFFFFVLALGTKVSFEWNMLRNFKKKAK